MLYDMYYVKDLQFFAFCPYFFYMDPKNLASEALLTLHYEAFNTLITKNNKQ